jgi:hypothetical protein
MRLVTKEKRRTGFDRERRVDLFLRREGEG